MAVHLITITHPTCPLVEGEAIMVITEETEVEPEAEDIQAIIMDISKANHQAHANTVRDSMKTGTANNTTLLKREGKD